jgi:type VI secretion system VasD/TssJ family lipoprotein
MRKNVGLGLVGLELGLILVLCACGGSKTVTIPDPKLPRNLPKGLGVSAEACERPPIEVFLQASPYINPNPKGQSMPVEVRVFLLRERETFDSLDFETVWQRGEEALAKDLLKSASLTVFPGKLKIYSMKSQPKASFVALVAVFRKPEADEWRHVFDIQDKNKRCATKDTLHTIVHALLKDSRIKRADTEQGKGEVAPPPSKKKKKQSD